MKRRFNNKKLKKVKKVIAFIPNNIRLSFYITPLEDVSSKSHFTSQDLDSIMLLNEQNTINPDLFDKPINTVEGNIYALLDEGVLNGQKTGADLGIYNYKVAKIEHNHTNQDILKVSDINKKEDANISFFEDEDFGFGNCILAEENPLSGKHTQVVSTFKGYLEVTQSEFSIIRRCDCTADLLVVYISQEDVSKYQLRNGDEIVCTYKTIDGLNILDSIFTINQESRYYWNVDRPWFNELNHSRAKSLKGVGDYTKSIVSKFKLLEGDSVFLYLNKTTQKNHILLKFVEELSAMFDKVVYINPQYKLSTTLGDEYKVVTFCTQSNESFNTKVTITLLGANYVKRLVEMGKRVAVLIDDIESILALDKNYDTEMPISKTILNSIKVSNRGSGTNFTIISLRNNNLNSYNINDIFRSSETLGIVIENNEIDLFNSYRI